ncbi:sodium/solute symporter [Desulfovibrio sulfodismutans]|uniref:Sodium/solute symporter n=1 Tax=Desulfolutivibrio sulfodismutans TaxID=63561 RepID=A0A7K3NIA9_9BACT|nr:sodium/solute symporter [Desulfolutivibrio sulfodismutans]NDY55922.1 sodium/solute symporter [Desulfolutivibrio sulfodismutans]QLA11185.1 sodium/solute symporter [Desulfolutivibrio sulfodismutans DSM 3696]
MFSIILLCVFFAFMIGVGVWGMRRTSSLNDFFLGGRSIGPWVSAVAYGTTYFSAVLFIGFAGKLGWAYGLNALWIAAGNAVFGSLMAWLILGKRTRRMTKNLDVMTMPEFLQERYDGKYLKIISALIIFVFLLPYSASVFKGLGYLFEANFNISFDTALLIMIGITGLYLVLGGYFAIAFTDFIQGIIMIFGSIVMVYLLVQKGGGLSEVLSTIPGKHLLHMPLEKQPGTLLLCALVFMTSFGTWGLPQMVQKFYAVKDESVIVKAAWATCVFALIIGFAAYFTGSMTHLFYDAPPLTASGAADFDRFIPDMLKTNLPEALMALILLLVLSASMSTLSSLVLVSASAVAIDLYKGHINPEVSNKASVRLIRLLSALFIVISYVIARYDFDIIITLMSLSWGAVAGAFMAPYIYGLFWKGATKAGVKAGMATGLVVNITLFFILGPAKSPIASSAAMIAPFAVVPLVSLFTRPPSERTIAQAFGAKG